jgi:hypothetical protein
MPRFLLVPEQLSLGWKIGLDAAFYVSVEANVAAIFCEKRDSKQA